MKIQTALKDLSYQIIWGEADQEVKEVIYDSRKAEPETVFVCMVGARIDSHDFMQEVAEKGLPPVCSGKGNSRGAVTKIARRNFGCPC